MPDVVGGVPTGDVTVRKNKAARRLSKGGESMPELLLEGLEQLTRDSDDPETLLIVARATGKFVGILSHYWDALRRRLQAGGFPAKLFSSECDKLLGMGDVPANFLDNFLEKGRKLSAASEDAASVYQEAQAAREQLDALMKAIRTARERTVASSGVSADPEELLRRIQEADDTGEWVTRPGQASRLRNGPPAAKE
jgi:hypothetical protein